VEVGCDLIQACVEELKDKQLLAKELEQVGLQQHQVHVV